jgi:hypothetical protein
MLIMFSQLRKRGSRGVSGVRHRFKGTDKVRSFPGWRVGNQPAPSIPTTLQRRIISSGSLWSTRNTDPTYGRHGLSRKCVAPVVTVQFTFKRSNLGVASILDIWEIVADGYPRTEEFRYIPTVLLVAETPAVVIFLTTCHI